MPNKIEFGPANLGELDTVLHNQGVSDLSWLAVDEAEYRAHEALPKQNLDMIPELQKALAFDPEEKVPSLIPMKPHVIVNQNPQDVHSLSPTDMTVPIRNRVASLVVRNLPVDVIQTKLSLEFSPGDLKIASAEINRVLDERGLMGNVYVNSEHFPRCSQNDSNTAKAIKASKKALFVIASNKCGDCTCNQSGRCSVFQKTLVSEVPYNTKLASHYVPERSFDNVGDVKSELKKELLSGPVRSNPDGVQTIRTQKKASKKVYSETEISEALSKTQGKVESLSGAYKKYATRMMSGRDDVAFLKASGDPDLLRLAGEFGILGHNYLDMDALGGCNATLSHVQSTGVIPRLILRRSASCSTCMCAADGACKKLSERSKIVSSVQYDKEMIANSLNAALKSGRMSTEEVKRIASSVSTVREYKPIISAINQYRPKAVVTKQYDQGNLKAHYNNSVKVTESIDERELTRYISACMNAGLTGRKLATAILSKFSKTALEPMKYVSDRFASEVGIQGHYYIDPTAYVDYGHGCSEGAKIFRKQGPANIMASSSCTGCSLQTSPGWCSKYAKTMIRSVPESVRTANDNSKKPLPVIKTASAVDLSTKYELDKSLTVDLNGSKVPKVDISFASKVVDD